MEEAGKIFSRIKNFDSRSIHITQPSHELRSGYAHQPNNDLRNRRRQGTHRCFFDKENVWLTQKLMAELFECSADNISLHLRNIYTEHELEENATTEEFSVVQTEGAREVKRTFIYYSLEAIIAVGYRINTVRGTQFRIWATDRLKSYILKGFAIDKDRFIKGSKFDARYFRIKVKFPTKWPLPWPKNSTRVFVLSKTGAFSQTSTGK